MKRTFASRPHSGVAPLETLIRRSKLRVLARLQEMKVSICECVACDNCV